jgi:hypothetical protein
VQFASALFFSFRWNLDSAFAETYRFTASFTQEVKLRTSDNRSTLHLDFVDAWRMERKLSLNTFAADDSPNHEHLACAGSTLGNHSSTENLNSLFHAFLNLGVNVYGVPNVELVYVRLEERLLNQVKNLLAHDRFDNIRMGEKAKIPVPGANMVTDPVHLGKTKILENVSWGCIVRVCDRLDWQSILRRITTLDGTNSPQSPPQIRSPHRLT